MITPGPSQASLAAAYLARSCALCAAAASITRIGDEARLIADVDLCLAHGFERWPWPTRPPAKREQRTRR
jgi:hypothetical protein